MALGSQELNYSDHWAKWSLLGGVLRTKLLLMTFYDSLIGLRHFKKRKKSCFLKSEKKKNTYSRTLIRTAILSAVYSATKIHANRSRFTFSCDVLCYDRRTCSKLCVNTVWRLSWSRRPSQVWSTSSTVDELCWQSLRRSMCRGEILSLGQSYRGEEYRTITFGDTGISLQHSVGLSDDGLYTETISIRLDFQ